MSFHQRSVDVRASRETTFDLLHDRDRRLRWAPFLRARICS